MASLFRPSSPADAAVLIDLAERSLGVSRDGPMFAAEQLDWKYWAHWPGSASPRSHVLVRDGRIVAHAGVWPLVTWRGGERLTVLHPFDWMSEPSAIGSGAALLQRLARLADGLLIVGGSEATRRMVQPLGFRALDDVGRYAAPLLFDGHADELRDRALTVAPVLEPTESDCERSTPPEPWLEFERTPAQLAFCQGCPAAPMTVYNVRRGDARVGAFVLAYAPGQARLAAFWTATAREEDLALVVRLARREVLKRGGVDEVVCMANDPRHVQALLSAGFHRVGAVPAYLLASRRELGPGVRVGFQMLDGDVVFLHHGARDPWL